MTIRIPLTFATPLLLALSGFSARGGEGPEEPPRVARENDRARQHAGTDKAPGIDPALRTPEEVIAAFRALWRGSLAERLEKNPHAGHLDRHIFEPERVEARAGDSGEAHRTLMNTSKAEERAALSVWGSHSNLLPARPVWVISNPGSFTGGFQAFIDRKDGRLLYLWVPPEG